jgi:ubiquinone/menaquinone biosynthesis C-methylase UbiE
LLIREILDEARNAGVLLRRGVNAQVVSETARLTQVTTREIVLETRHFERGLPESVHLNFVLRGIPYFFSTPPSGEFTGQTLQLLMPDALYQVERRDRRRIESAELADWPSAISISTEAGFEELCEVIDVSAGGLAMYVPEGTAPYLTGALRVHVPERSQAGGDFFGLVRNQLPAGDRPGWLRIGLSTTPEPPRKPLEVDRRSQIAPPGSRRRDRTRVGPVRESAAERFQRTTPTDLRTSTSLIEEVRVVDYLNGRGEKIRAIVNSWGDTRGAPAVVIPPAWGRTKETLLPLAETVVETFRLGGQPVTVIRFDGIRRRGESHNDPECREPGRECLKFTHSQGIDDIRATLDFLERDAHFRPGKTVLITFSAASVEGRRAVSLEQGRRLAGWISVVGTADIQSVLRVISGGIDYAGGAERGVRFGLQELLGVLVDMDHLNRDALEYRLAYLEDALDDMRRITVPITWIHGRDDAWMNLDRVRLALAAGDSSHRCLIEVPTGHQLRTSREAFETFQLIASEVARIATGRTLQPALPSVRRLKWMWRAERTRLPRPRVELKAFWKDYLLGRSEGRIGIELITRSTAYRKFMKAQVQALQLSPGARVADLGSGTGSFIECLAHLASTPSKVRIDALDLVSGALERGRTHHASLIRKHDATMHCIACDLSASVPWTLIPIRDGVYDAVLASLLLSYIAEPPRLLKEIHRILRPGGRVVLSSLKKDADISKLYVDAYAEVMSPEAQLLAGTAGAKLSLSAQDFLNDASRLLDMEELRVFQFWDQTELTELVRASGFQEIHTASEFGVPPQAIILSARRAL